MSQGIAHCRQIARRAIALALGFACVLSAWLAMPAGAQSCRSPEGISGIDQYCEAVPGGGGNQGPSDLQAGRPGRLPSGLDATRDGRALRGFSERSLERRRGSAGASALAGSGKGRVQSDDLWLVALLASAGLASIAAFRWVRKRADVAPGEPEPLRPEAA